MLTLQNKLYVQLRPDVRTRGFLLNDALRFKGRPVTAKELHVTVLHIGKIEKLFFAVRKEVEISESDFLDIMQALVRELEALKAECAEHIFNLHADRFDTFGVHTSVLVVRLRPSDALLKLHLRSLEILRYSLHACGINNPDDFIVHNESLRHSLDFQPHVSITRNIKGTPPAAMAPPTMLLSFLVMDVVYAT